MNMTLKPITVPQTNIIDNVAHSNRLIDKTYLTNLQCIPRPIQKIPKQRREIKSPWTIQKSIFKNYQSDSEVRKLSLFLGPFEQMF